MLVAAMFSQWWYNVGAWFTWNKYWCHHSFLLSVSIDHGTITKLPQLLWCCIV